MLFLNFVEPSGMIGHVLPLFCPSLSQFDPKTTLHHFKHMSKALNLISFSLKCSVQEAMHISYILATPFSIKKLFATNRKY